MIDEYLFTKCLYEVMVYLDRLTNEEIIMSFKVKCDKENNTLESIAEQKLIINYNIQYNLTSEIAIKATITNSILLESSFILLI